MKATPVKRNLDSLVNNIVKELNQANQDADTKRVRELNEMFQQALELSEFYKNISNK